MADDSELHGLASIIDSEVQRHVADMREAANRQWTWSGEPYVPPKVTLRQHLRYRVHGLRERIALIFAPWLERDDWY